jgi:hypothetical protein
LIRAPTRDANSQASCKLRLETAPLRIHPLHDFALRLAPCVSAGVAMPASSTTREAADDRSADHRCSFAFANSDRVSGFVASHNKVICGQKILRPIGRKAGYGFEFPSPLIEFPHRSSGRFGGYVVFSARNFRKERFP